ncbi:MAG: hypothetical protein E7623_06770 [Ruminococcaceae bacterium]|nr:hypothetical protein [Oscillospiraceae bacterium]
MKRLVAIILVLVVCISSTACMAHMVEKITDITAGTTYETEEEPVTPTVFEKDGSIYLSDGKSDKAELLSSGGRYMPSLSEDGTKVLYAKSMFETPGNAIVFGIMDIEGKDIIELTVECTNNNTLTSVEWISDRLVGVETHVNPSTSEYFVYKVSEEGRLAAAYTGLFFTPIPNTEKVVYRENVPHFSEEPIYHSYMIGEKKVYTSEKLNAELGAPVFSDDLGKMAFIETAEDGRTLVICDFDFAKLGVKVKRTIPLEQDISGELCYRNGAFCMVDGSNRYKF